MVRHYIKGSSINYHHKVLFMLNGLRFVILRSFLGSIYLFVQSYSSPYSFTHKQIDHQKEPRNLTKLIYRNALNRYIPRGNVEIDASRMRLKNKM